MKILLLESFYTGSHKKWADEFKQFSRHEVEIVSLSGHHWKWRMHGGAISMADKITSSDTKPDLILATDMIDLSLFLSVTRSWSHNTPTAIYFHENQLNYPWSPDDADVKLQRDNHYAFINYTSAFSADHVLFNSQYHQSAFLEELPKFLRAFPDNNNLDTIHSIERKSSVLPLGMNLKKMDSFKKEKIEKHQRATILWNHRWEYDKNPEFFFKSLFQLAEYGIDFRLIVAGESYGKQPSIFNEAKSKLADKILHFGFVESYDDYCRLLRLSDISPVTSQQDFFGGSVVEAMYCNVVPFLPKRLAYPEHIPSQLHSTFFYDEKDFLPKLQRRIMDVKYLRVMDTCQYVLKYDWSNLIKEYDNQMDDIVSRSKT